MTGYYDYVLGAIPLALLGITAVLSIVGLPLTVAVPAGAGTASLVVAHALFVNGPVDSTPADAPARPSAPVNAD